MAASELSVGLDSCAGVTEMGLESILARVGVVARRDLRSGPWYWGDSSRFRTGSPGLLAGPCCLEGEPGQQHMPQQRSRAYSGPCDHMFSCSEQQVFGQICLACSA